MKAADFYNKGIFKDYYSVLQVTRNAEPEIISMAYKALAKKYHPDMGGSEEKMGLINEAYEVLGDAEGKKEYDKIYDLEKSKKPPKVDEEVFRNNIETEKKESKNNFDRQVYTDFGRQTHADSGCHHHMGSEGNNECNTINDAHYFKELLIKRGMKENISNNIFEVYVKGHSFNIPFSCVCCLKEPDIKLKVKYMFGERNTLANHYKFFYMFFPICHECKKHMMEYLIKRILFICISLLPGILVTWYLAGGIFEAAWPVLMLTGFIITAASTFLASLVINLSVLGGQHANRGSAVGISYCDEYGTRIWFANWLYAQMFAKNNGCIVTEAEQEKSGRDVSFFKGRVGLQTIGLIFFAITVVITVISFLRDNLQAGWERFWL